MTDYTTLIDVGLPFIVGIVAKWGHGIIITKMNQFRTVVDDIDDTLNGTNTNPQQTITDIQKLVNKAQQL